MSGSPEKNNAHNENPHRGNRDERRDRTDGDEPAPLPFRYGNHQSGRGDSCGRGADHARSDPRRQERRQARSARREVGYRPVVDGRSRRAGGPAQHGLLRCAGDKPPCPCGQGGDRRGETHLLRKTDGADDVRCVRPVRAGKSPGCEARSRAGQTVAPRAPEAENAH